MHQQQSLRRCRKSAVAGRRDVQVTISSGAVSLTRQTAIPEDPPAGFTPLNLPGRNDNQIVAPTGAVLTPATITFYPRGDSSGGTVEVPGGGSITVVAETGYVY